MMLAMRKNFIRHFLFLSFLVMAFLSGGRSQVLAAGFDLSECDEVHTVMEDPFPPLGDEAAGMVAGIVCKKVHELAPLFGVKLDGRRLVGLLITESMESFAKRTGRGPYTLAVFSSRYGIITQPAQTLQQLSDNKRLERTLTHELTHFFIDKVAGRSCPSWLHEGLAQWFEGLRPRHNIMISAEEVAKLEMRWHMPGISLRQRSLDYQISLMLVAKIIRRAGQEALLASLKGINACRDKLDLAVGERSVREWLLSADAPVEEKETAAQGGFEIVRGEEWQEQLREEVTLSDKDGKVVRFGAGDENTSRLPLKEMLKKARRKKRKK
jgi:hypothetical protein